MWNLDVTSPLTPPKGIKSSSLLYYFRGNKHRRRNYSTVVGSTSLQRYNFKPESALGVDDDIPIEDVPPGANQDGLEERIFTDTLVAGDYVELRRYAKEI